MYKVYEWSPKVAGELVCEAQTIEQACDAALDYQQAQICSDHWSGYVTTWASGGASAKHFQGADKYGWGGDVPLDAQECVRLLAGH